MSSPRLSIVLPLLAFCVLSRVPSFRASVDPEVGTYLWNFSPLLATVLFSGAVYRHWGWSVIAPLVTYLLGDVAVWLASGDIADAFHPISVWTYAAVAAVLGCGWRLRRGPRLWGRIAVASLTGAIAFFVVSNFGSWLMDPWLPSPTGYARGLEGLLQSYVAALPFWRNDLASMLLFSGLWFSPWGVALLTRDTEAVTAADSLSATIRTAQ